MAWKGMVKSFSRRKLIMEEKKMIPLGIEDFKEVKQHCYYVDKTALIKQILNEPPGTAILFARPRRFGKSLALSMLSYFFDISSEANEDLFEGTSIYDDNDIFSSYFKAFPLVHLNLKNAIGDDKETLMIKTAECIKNEYRRHEFLLNSDKLSKEDKEYFKAMLSSAEEELPSSSLANLTRFLHIHYGKRAIVLIDEYDTPIRYAYENGFYLQVISYFKSFFGEAMKGNPHLYYAILTGILQVSKESIFSGLNNLSVNTVLDEAMDEGFGFTEKEVDGLLSHYGLSDKKQSFREWYDGYLFGKSKIYNPISVLSAIKKGGRMEPYWSNTSEKNALYELVAKDSSDIGFLSKILLNKQAETKIDLAISYLDLDSAGYLPSYLLSTGYLTIEKEISYDTYLVRIPNKEIESVFEKEIIERYLPREKENLSLELKKALLKGEAKRIESLFGKRILAGLSYFDFGSEKSYQIMLLSALSIALTGHKINLEANAGYGRSDIIAFPLDKEDPGIIIEVKVAKGRLSSSRLEASSQFALRQIEEMDYVDLLKGRGIKKAILYGVSFASKSIAVSSKEITIG